MPDPVSWLLIRPGWKVYASDGAEVGEVDEVTGDDTQDIFDGIALATSVLGQPRYVPADFVREITEGSVHLSLARDEVAALTEYQDPATSAEIEADNKGRVAAGLGAEARKVEGVVLHPTQRHQHPMNVWRRMYFAVRRLVGR
jgi:hypothetical protein